MIFVYVRGLHGPEPQKWPEMLYDTNGKPQPHLVQHLLPEAQKYFDLESLMAIYPAPVIEKEKKVG